MYIKFIEIIMGTLIIAIVFLGAGVWIGRMALTSARKRIVELENDLLESNATLLDALSKSKVSVANGRKHKLL